jgi:hypothetical protein
VYICHATMQQVQPSCLVVTIQFEILSRLPMISQMKVIEDDMKSLCSLYVMGNTRATMVETKGSRSHKDKLTQNPPLQFEL